MLVALSAVFAGVKRYRDIDRGGVVGFLPALGLGLGISMVASLFYVMAWEAAIAYAHLDFGGFYAKYLVHHAKTHGVTGAALAKVIADAEAFLQRLCRSALPDDGELHGNLPRGRPGVADFGRPAEQPPIPGGQARLNAREGGPRLRPPFPAPISSSAVQGIAP